MHLTTAHEFSRRSKSHQQTGTIAPSNGGMVLGMGINVTR
jgi:hypothetical protein